MLADPELEAVSIVTMWDRHTAPTIPALQAGKHVFLENRPSPISIGSSPSRPRARSSFKVGHIYRFNPRYTAAKEAIADCVHDTDLMFGFSGSRAVTAYAQTVRVRDHAHPDLGQVMYRLENGAS